MGYVLSARPTFLSVYQANVDRNCLLSEFFFLLDGDNELPSLEPNLEDEIVPAIHDEPDEAATHDESDTNDESDEVDCCGQDMNKRVPKSSRKKQKISLNTIFGMPDDFI